jgi:hypothetical protein
MSDPLRDLERRVDSLAAKVDLSDSLIRADIDAIKADVERLGEAHSAFVSRSWAVLVLVISAALGGLVSIVTRSS